MRFNACVRACVHSFVQNTKEHWYRSIACNILHSHFVQYYAHHAKLLAGVWRAIFLTTTFSFTKNTLPWSDKQVETQGYETKEEITAHWKEMSSSRLAPTLPLFVKERCVTINERMCRTSGFIQMYWFAKDWKLSHTITQIVIDVGHKVEFISCTSCNLKQHNAKHYQQWTHDAI